MMITLDEARRRWRQNKGRWPNFRPKEMACRCSDCGHEVWWDEDAFDAIQAVRTAFGKPIRLNCSHRCVKNNARVGGAKRSQHLKIAFDISLRKRTAAEKRKLDRLLIKHGFVTRGCYRTFLHTDRRTPPRYWIVKGGEENAKIFKRVE